MPKYGETLRILLPECYRRLPLRAEPLDANQMAYNDPNIKLDDMWPCVLTGTNTENVNNVEVNHNIIPELPSSDNNKMEINKTFTTNEQ